MSYVWVCKSCLKPDDNVLYPCILNTLPCYRCKSSTIGSELTAVSIEEKINITQSNDDPIDLFPLFMLIDAILHTIK